MLVISTQIALLDLALEQSIPRCFSIENESTVAMTDSRSSRSNRPVLVYWPERAFEEITRL